MKKVLKIVGIVIAVILVLLFTAPILFKGQLLDITKEQINKNVNAKVAFSNFDVTIFHSFPNLTVTLDELSVIGIDKFENDTLLYLKQLYTDLDVMSVINGETIDVKAIVLDSPVIRGLILADSSANWDIAKASATEEEEVDTTSSEPAQFKLGLETFKITDADIVFDDKTSNTYAAIKEFNFDLGGDFTADQTNLDILMSIAELTAKASGVSYLNKANMSFKAGVAADLANQKFTFSENIFQINALELGFDGFVEMPDETMKLDIKFNTNKTDFKSLLSMVPGVFLEGFEGIETDGNLHLEGMAKGLLNTDQEIYPAFDLKLVVDDAMFKYPDLPKSVDDININLAITNPDGVLDHTVVDLSKFHISFAQNPFDVVLQVKTPISDPSINCNFNGKIDLDNMKDFIPIEDTKLSGIITTDISLQGTVSQIEQEKYEEFKALGNLAIQNFTYSSPDLEQGANIKITELEFTPQYVYLKSFDSKIGNSDIQMNGRLENFIPYALTDGTLKGELNLTSTLFDTNEFMSDDTTAIEEAETVDTAATEIVEVPGNIEFYLNSLFNTITYEDMKITDVRGNIVVKDSKVDLSNLSMNLLQGSMIMNGYYSTADIKKPTADFNMNITDFDITETFTTFNSVKEIAPFLEKCKGKFSTVLELNMLMGNDMSPVLNTVNGLGQFKSKNVEIVGAKSVEELATKLKYKKLEDINLKDVDAKITIVDGNVTIDPFETKVDDMKATIGGTSNLDQTIDYKIAMEVPRDKFGGAANQVVDGLLAQASSYGVNASIGDIVNIDAFIKGTMDDPKVSFKLSDSQNSGTSAKQQLKDQAKAELAKAKAEAEAKARAAADKAKAEATRKKKEAEAKAKAEAEKKKKEAEAKAKAEAEKQKKKAESEAKKQLKNIKF